MAKVNPHKFQSNYLICWRRGSESNRRRRLCRPLHYSINQYVTFICHPQIAELAFRERSLQSVSGVFLCSEGRRAFFLRTATQRWQVPNVGTRLPHSGAQVVERLQIEPELRARSKK